MSSTVMANTPPLSPDFRAFTDDDTFDSSTFPFLQPSFMDSYLVCPDMTAEGMNQQQEQPEGREQMYMGNDDRSEFNYNLARLNLSGSPSGEQVQHQATSTFGYPMPQYSNPNTNVNFFHPYRMDLRAHQSPHSPMRPMSPPLSTPGSAGPHFQPLNHSPAGVSPNMISPNSMLGGNLSDNSPLGQWSALPYAAQLGGPSNMTNPTAPFGTALGMVTNYPYPAQMTSVPLQQVTRGRPRPARQTRVRRSRTPIKKEDDDDDVISDLDDNEPRRSNTSRRATESRSEGAGEKGSGKKEDVRRARIESEQRRRDELREGFKILKSHLPASSQRSSKCILLDRACEHIKFLTKTNSDLMNQNERLQRELDELRACNTELVHAVAVNTRPSSSPGSHARGQATLHQ
ncbi:hypothetical protein TREMEDRAFT_59857 [Tremella mesenterica DSM 1558]|uniref:uncharacterized protein n=1 Tax=Tremella mesenterica (strain ATCC 24925 / CBS 8224 / DSM 1558 / NBRC 9311 / NRRL Y-6157 / RJB 2259-6 / UBC 559-6) TaxID=578456 RepID=UPI0003F4A526|nr:uncharacterized protein TREMEDRAFT_59857 [Tremella mesenterica DSM 1558]EIW73684.1 hypothetical protein TREMEDRAFT_59857 [Tremella mesenterica DSM 1558]